LTDYPGRIAHEINLERKEELHMAGIIDTNIVMQVAFVVRDIEVTKKKFAEFLGVEPPHHFETNKSVDNIVEGKPAPDVSAQLAFFDVGPGLAIELIQPNGVRSVWQDVLDQKGEGFHHIAFKINGMDERIQACKNAGMKCVQKGKGYAYMDATADLKCLIELLGE
jgi:methylmalonyl-CoA/ethylmalonyl-CoA epimerase